MLSQIFIIQNELLAFICTSFKRVEFFDKFPFFVRSANKERRDVYQAITKEYPVTTKVKNGGAY